MKNKDKPMIDRTIQILNKIISNLDNYYYTTEETINYCKRIKKKLEEESQEEEKVK